MRASLSRSELFPRIVFRAMKLHDMVNYVFKTAFPQYEMGREVFEGSHI